jgi:carboxylesterase type B
MLVIFLLQLLLFCCPIIIARDVQTEYGTVRGHPITVNLEDNVQKTVTSFLGIPFATPPIGDLRFERPQKAQPWTDVFVADTLGDVCMQGFTFGGLSEDCLTVNIFVPEDSSGEPYPVMVWLYGGGYTAGGNTQYPGHFLATHDVIIVVPNYRLGVIGFASTSDGLLKGNMGLFDQKLALEFVRDNIANFGGDPNKVTIFGESAGAASTALHMVSPLSRGLFHQAIEESGSDNNLWTINGPGQNPDNYIYQVAENANCATDDIPTMVDCLKSLSAEDLLAADNITCATGYVCLGFAPIVDGPGGFIPDLPLTLRENLGADSVPLLSGINKDDGSLFTLAFVPEATRGGFNHSEFEYYLENRILRIYEPRLTPEQFTNVYDAMNFFYTNWPYVEDLDANRQAINQLLTDTAFGMPWDRQAKINSQFAPTYTYVMAFRRFNATGITEWMGVPHAAEIPFVWGYGYLFTNPDVRNDSDVINPSAIGELPEDIAFTNYVQTLWTNFAKYGNPTPSPVPAPFNDTLTVWPEYRADDNFKVFYLDTEISVKELYNQLNYYFYNSYIEVITGMPIKSQPAAEDEDAVRFSAAEFAQVMSDYYAQVLFSQYTGESEEEF